MNEIQGLESKGTEARASKDSWTGRKLSPLGRFLFIHRLPYKSSGSFAFAWVSHSHYISLLGLNFNPTLQSAFLSFVSISPFPPDCTWLPISLTSTLLGVQICDSGLGFQPWPVSGLCCVLSDTQILRVEYRVFSGELLGVDSHHH